MSASVSHFVAFATFALAYDCGCMSAQEKREQNDDGLRDNVICKTSYRTDAP